MAERTEPVAVVLHPKLAEAAARLLSIPGLTHDTIARIRRDLDMDKP